MVDALQISVISSFDVSPSTVKPSSKILDPSLDLTSVLVVFAMCLQAVPATAVLVTINSSCPRILRVVLEEMVFHTNRNQNDTSLSRRKTHSSNNDKSREKPDCIKYDHERASKCMNNDWMEHILCFPGQSFHRAFQIQRRMVEVILPPWPPLKTSSVILGECRIPQFLHHHIMVITKK